MKFYAWWSILKALHAFLEAIPYWECKTIGNLHPDDLHCLSCTFWDIKKRVKRAVEFWAKGDRWKRAIS